MLTSGLSQLIISPNDTFLQRQNVGSLGSIGMPTYSKCAIPWPTEAPETTATLCTLLVGFNAPVTPLAVDGALFIFEPPKNV